MFAQDAKLRSPRTCVRGLRNLVEVAGIEPASAMCRVDFIQS